MASQTDDPQTGNPWTTLSIDSPYENPWIRVEHHEVLNPSGQPGIYGVVRFKNLAVGVVPIDQSGCVSLVGQHRYPHNAYSWEIPEGGAPLDRDPLEQAQRELVEETGLSAESWAEILRMDLSNSVSDESAVVYLAWDLSQGAASPEETERLVVRQVPFAAALEMAKDGRIRDSMSVAGLLRVGLMLASAELPAPLAAVLQSTM